MFDWMPVRVCPCCEGVGTVQTPDAAAPGKTFSEVCSRCRGVGQVRGQLTEKKEVGDGR